MAEDGLGEWRGDDSGDTRVVEVGGRPLCVALVMLDLEGHRGGDGCGLVFVLASRPFMFITWTPCLQLFKNLLSGGGYEEHADFSV